MPLLPAELRNFADRAGRIRQWPRKRSLQLMALAYLATRFEAGRVYREREVNAILQDWHTFRDWTRLRRDLVDLGHLKRKADGSAYWLGLGPPAGA
jgi:hypothetical protein